MANADDELARARLWQDQQRRRRSYRQGLAASLSGNAARAQQVRDDWQPLLDADQDRTRQDAGAENDD